MIAASLCRKAKLLSFNVVLRISRLKNYYEELHCLYRGQRKKDTKIKEFSCKFSTRFYLLRAPRLGPYFGEMPVLVPSPESVTISTRFSRKHCTRNLAMHM